MGSCLQSPSSARALQAVWGFHLHSATHLRAPSGHKPCLESSPREETDGEIHPRELRPQDVWRPVLLGQEAERKQGRPLGTERPRLGYLWSTPCTDLGLSGVCYVTQGRLWASRSPKELEGLPRSGRGALEASWPSQKFPCASCKIVTNGPRFRAPQSQASLNHVRNVILLNPGFTA